MGQLDDYFTKLKLIVASDQWRTDQLYQAERIHALGQSRGELDNATIDRFVGVIADSLDLPHDRVRWMLYLEQPEEIVTSLQSTTKDPHTDELFPRDGWLGDYLRHTSGNEVPLRWNFWCGLSMLSTALRRNTFVDCATFKVWPNFYIIIVEDSGKRKSTAMGFSKSVFRRLNQLIKLQPDYELHHTIPLAPDSGTFVKFAETIQSHQVIIRDEFGVDKLVLTDATAYLVADDLVTILSKSNFDASTWIENLTHMWDYQGDWTRKSIASHERNKGDVILRNPALTFIGGTTNEWIRHSVTPEMIGGGFMSRCIFINQPAGTTKRIAWPQPLDPVGELMLANKLLPLTRMTRRPMAVSTEYRNWYEVWYNSYADGLEDRIPDEKLRAYYTRRPVMVHKLSMMLAVSRGSFTITQADGELADAIFTREELNLDLNFVKIGAHKDSLMCDKIVAYIDRKGGKIKHTDLFKAFSTRVGNSKQFKEMMTTLVEQGRIHSKRHNTTGGGIEYLTPDYYQRTKDESDKDK